MSETASPGAGARTFRSGIGRRVVIASSLSLLVISATFVVLVLAIEDVRASERRVERSREVLASASQLERLVVDLETGQRGFVITGEERFLEPWHEARAAIPEQARTLEQLVADNAAQLKLAKAITQQAMSYINDYSVPLLDAARRDLASVRTVAATNEGKIRVDELRVQFDDLTATERTQSLAHEERSDAAARRAFVAAAAGIGASILLMLAFVLYLTRAIVRPVLGTAAMAERLAGGDLAVRVPEDGVGEIRTLERAFNDMARSLEDARADLAASRARIVRSADDTRRAIERDLHDGIQQRLVSLALDLRAAQADAPGELDTRLDRVGAGLAAALDELREISRGIHPAILSSGGLPAALKLLARRSTIPVALDLEIDSRLPAPVEVAAYYIVSEALTNAAKHSRASVIDVSVDQRDGALHLSIHDDGGGGADLSRGTGLIGLSDRIQTLGGTLEIDSPADQGTSVHVAIPLPTDSAAPVSNRSGP